VAVCDLTARNAIKDRLWVRIYIFIFFSIEFSEGVSRAGPYRGVHGLVREVVRGPSPLDWSMDQGSVFSGYPV